MPGIVRSGGQPAWRLELHERLVSTNDHCIGAAERGAPEGLAVLARSQSGGRGSRGRSWVEPPAGNLALSVLLRPVSLAEPGLWPFVAGLALHDGLEAVSSAPLMLKWPNDLLFDGRKLAGILIERGVGASGIWMVIGFGANLREAPAIQGRMLACLAEAGPAPTQEAAAASVLEALGRWCAVLAAEGFAPIRAAWLERAYPVGTPLAVRLPEGAAGAASAPEVANGASGAQTEGSFSGIAPDGALELLASGRTLRVETGDVLLLGGTR